SEGSLVDPIRSQHLGGATDTKRWRAGDDKAVAGRPESTMTIRAYMCGRETLTVERNREWKWNVEAAIVAIKAEVVHTRHKGIGADGEVVPARHAGRGVDDRTRHYSPGATKPSGRRGFRLPFCARVIGTKRCCSRHHSVHRAYGYIFTGCVFA